MVIIGFVDDAIAPRLGEIYASSKRVDFGEIRRGGQLDRLNEPLSLKHGSLFNGLCHMIT
jgi:hypothetical protein